MALFVIDASVAIAWLFGDEADSPRATAIVQRALVEGTGAPSIWPAEVLNVLLMAGRRRRIAAERVDALVSDLANLAASMEIETRSDEASLRHCLLLARKRSLSAYDASYLALALTRSLPLATFDLALRRAATAERVALID